MPSLQRQGEGHASTIQTEGCVLDDADTASGIVRIRIDLNLIYLTLHTTLTSLKWPHQGREPFGCQGAPYLLRDGTQYALDVYKSLNLNGVV